MVDVSAVRLGMPDLAVGDLLGSCLFNLLILAVADLFHRAPHRMLSGASVAHALSATQTIVMTGLAGLGILLAPRIASYAIAGLSYGTLAILVAYVLGLRLVYYDQRLPIAGTPAEGAPPSDGRRPSRLTRPVLGYLTAAAAVLVAAPFLAEAAGEIAEATGLGNTFVGTTLVAFCTSLPELVTTAAAVRMGAFDLALGNIFGSNAFNVVILVPLDFVSPGPLLVDVSPAHAVTDLAVVVITGVTVLGQLYRAERRWFFLEPDAALVIVLVTLTLWGLYFLR